MGTPRHAGVRLPFMTRVERWERRTEVPLILLAVAFLAAYACQVVDRSMSPGLSGFLSAVSWTVWCAFALDFLIRLVLADEHWRYALGHWYDVALIVLPVLRPLRLLRLVALVRVLDRSVAGSLAGRVAVYVAGSASLAVGLGALATLDAEQDAEGANITTYSDALWWACTTVTTVGYGDHFPITATGRVVAVALMLVGIGLVGSVTAAVTAWILGRVEADRERRAADHA
jgi:voltage-gated potassium channel